MFGDFKAARSEGQIGCVGGYCVNSSCSVCSLLLSGCCSGWSVKDKLKADFAVSLAVVFIFLFFAFLVAVGILGTT